MTGGEPAILGTAVLSWRDGLRALRDMPLVAVVAYMANFLAVAGDVLLEKTADKSLSIHLLGLGLSILQIFLLTPVAIAVHRYVLLGEVTHRYALNPASRQFKNFFAYGVIIQVMFEIPTLFIGVVNIGTVLVWFVGAIFLSIRTLILFPAIAVNARNAIWWNALRDSKGHFWRILAIVLTISLPLFLLFIPIVVFVIKPYGLAIFGAFLSAAIAVPTLAAYAAMASHLYRAWAVRLG
jgi:hypothetical protein